MDECKEQRIYLTINFGLSFTSGILRSTMIVPSLWRHSSNVCTYFSIYGNKRPIPTLWYQLNVSGRFTFPQGVNSYSAGGLAPLVNRDTETNLSGTRVKITYLILFNKRVVILLKIIAYSTFFFFFFYFCYCIALTLVLPRGGALPVSIMLPN